MKAYGFVFARGGSKGIKNKNVQEINGISLVGHAVKVGIDTPEIDKVFVSSDCNVILGEGEKYGAVPIKRPAYLATDYASELEAWKHAIEFLFKNGLSCECFVSLPPTSPLRQVSDISEAIKCFEANQKEKLVFAVTESSLHPGFNLVRKDEISGSICRYDQTMSIVKRRQDAQKAYQLTTVVYAVPPLQIGTLESLWQLENTSIEIPIQRSIDIDTQIDLDFCRFLKSHNNNDR